MSDGDDREATGPEDTERKTVSRSFSNSRTAEPESDAEAFEFDVALACSENDGEEALRITEELQQLVLQDGTTARVCLFNDERFGGSIISRPPILLERCRFVFLLQTNNTTEDNSLSFFIEQVLGHTRLETRCKEHRVRVLHTEPESCCRPDIPTGLLDTQPLVWHQPLDRAKSEIIQLLSFNRKIKSGGQTSSGKTKEKKEMTPQAQKIRDDSNCILKNSQGEMYFPTYATRVSMDTLKLKGSLLISGRSGDGKTTTVYHILTELMKTNPAFQPFIVSKPEDLDHIPLQDSIIFIDNMFGVSHFSSVLLEQWKVRFPALEAYVEEGSMYFIATSSCHVLANCSQQIKNLSLLANRVDMVDEYSLQPNEKAGILRSFLGWKGLSMTESEIQEAVNSTLTLGFPQCCKLYVTNKEAQQLRGGFFEKPYIFLNEQIAKFETSEIDVDRVLYQILLHCVFKKGQFLSELLNVSIESVAVTPPKSSPPTSYWLMLNELCRVPNCSIEDRRLAAKSLVKMGFLRYIEQGGVYEFPHQSIYDAICISLGRKDYIQEVLALSPASFLLNHTSVAADCSESVIQIPEVHRPLLVDRIISELKQGNFKILEHTLFCQRESVEKVFKEKEFVKGLTDMFQDQSQILEFWHQELLYFLSASNGYANMVLKIIEMLEKISEDDGQIPEGVVQSFLEKRSISLSKVPTSVTNIKKELIHQCFEGACNSGNLRIFNKLKRKTHPCNDCFEKAVKSQMDLPRIFQELLALTTEFCMNPQLLIGDLLKQKKSKSLDAVMKSDKLCRDIVCGDAFQLFIKACMSGSFEMFDKLKNYIRLPKDWNNELLFASVRGGNREILKEFITEGNKNCVDEEGRTLLHIFCENEESSDETLLDFLLETGIDTSSLDKEGRSALHLACRSKDVNVLKKLIKHGVEVTVTNTEQNRQSPLHMAVQNQSGHLMVDMLIKTGPRDLDMVNFQGGHGLTPLHIAAQRHDVKMINKLLEKKADHSIRDNQGQTALHKVIEMNLFGWYDTFHRKSFRHFEINSGSQMESVQLLLATGSALHLADNDGNTMLHIAVRDKREVLKHILEKWTGEVCLNGNGLSPLHLLFGPSTSLESMNLLLDKFPFLLRTPTTDGRSVLHIALEQRSPYHIIREILQKSSVDEQLISWCDLNVGHLFNHFTDDELSQFVAACAGYLPTSVKYDICKHICEQKGLTDDHWEEIIDLLDVENLSHQSSLIYLVLDYPARLKYLIDKGFPVDVGDKEMETQRNVVVINSDTSSRFETRFEAAADVKTMQNTGATPLHHLLKSCICFELFECERYITGISTAVKNIKRKPLAQHLLTIIHKLFGSEYLIIDTDAHDHSIVTTSVSILLDKVSNVNTQDSNGLTPLHYSVFDEEILSQLVAAGGDVNLTTQDGWSCLHMACLVNNKNVVRYLLERGVSPFKGDTNEITPFQVALISADEDLIQEMLSVFDKHQERGLPQAVSLPSADSMADLSVLLEKDSEGHLPIFYAIERRSLAIVEVLTQGMKKAEKEKERKGRVKCIQYPDSNQPESQPEHTDGPSTPTLKHLLDTYGEVDTGDLLHVACEMESPLLLQFLVKEGFQVNSCCEDKRTPLHVSTINKHSDNVDFLLREGAEVNCVDCDGMTPLMFSCKTRFPSYEVKSNLICNNASVKTRSKSQQTPLHFLAASKAFDGYSLLTSVDMHSDPQTAALIKIVKLLIEQGADVNAKDKQGQTPLHLAADAGNTEFVRIMLHHGAEVDFEDNNGMTPLMYSCKKRYLSFEIVSSLIRNNASVKARNQTQQTPLHFLAASKPFDRFRLLDNVYMHSAPQTVALMKIVKLLTEQGVDVNAKDKQGQTSLHLAAATGDTEFVRILLHHGAEVDFEDNNGMTPLMYSCNTRLPSYEVISNLICNNASVKRRNQTQQTPLHFLAASQASAGYSHLTNLALMKIVKLLIAQGADYNAKDKQGQTPLHLAAAAGNPVFVRTLLHHGAEVDFEDNNGMTPLMYSCKSFNPSFEIVSSLISTNASVKKRNQTQQTPLHFLAFNRFSYLAPIYMHIVSNRDTLMLKIFKLLIEQGADVKAKDKQGQTPLHLATDAGNTEFVRIMLHHGAEVDCEDNDGMTPLMYSCKNEDLSFEIVSSLIRNNASVKARSKSQQSPLHFLASTAVKQYSHVPSLFMHLRPQTVDLMNIVKLLLKEGADVNAKDQRGQTPLHLAVTSGDIEFVRIMLDHGADINCFDCEEKSPLLLALEGGFWVIAGCCMDSIDQSRWRRMNLLHSD